MSWKDLPIPYRILVLTGAWCPEHWSNRRKIIYSFYSLITVLVMFSLNGFQIAKLLFDKSDSFEEFNDTFNVALSINAINVKLAGTLIYHDRIVNIIKMLEKTCCQARDETEINMKKDYHTYARKIFRFVEGFVGFLGLLHTLGPLKEGIGNRELPFNVLLPYNLTDPIAYWLTYFQHFFVAVLGGGISISIDLLITSFLLDLCCQCEILKYRIQQLPSKIICASKFHVPAFDRYLLKDIVHHHAHLYNVAKAMRRTFGGIIIYEFYVDTVEIGVTVYQSTLGTSKAERQIFYVVYICCMLGQLYFNCYFGNEVAVKSASIRDALYNSDWTGLTIRWKKNFLIIMKQSSKAIIISTRGFVHLMLETFVKIVKTSYSGYSILKSSA